MVEIDRSAEWLKYCGPDWYGEQDENGVDLSLIRRNLTLTLAERLRQGDSHADDLRLLMEHARRNREKQAGAAG